MTLTQRLLIAISLLVAVVCVGLSLAMQQAWQSTEQEQFENEFGQATVRLKQQLREELSELPRILQPLCQHGQMVDSALTALLGGGLEPDQRHALSLLTPATQRAFGFDELVLFTSSGITIGNHQRANARSRGRSLAALRESSKNATFDVEGVPSVNAHCVKSRGGQAVGLYAARHFNSILRSIGDAHALTLSLTEPQERRSDWVRVIRLPELHTTQVFATPRAITVDKAIADLNITIAKWGFGSLCLALLLGWFFARRLAGPIVELSEQATQVINSEPKLIHARGGKELVQLAASFNQAIGDLARLRKQLAVIERIAAEREIALRVAHEIKNPLAPIRAAIETLRRLKGRDDPNFESYFDEATKTVLSEVSRIANIVKQFTEFARLPPPSLAQVDLPELIRGVANLYQQELTALTLDLGELPDIRADRDQVVQVLTNLIQNSLDAVQGNDAGTVRISAHAKDKEAVEIRVEDNGPGVSETVRRNLFKPYVTTKEKGTGLGLAIVQRILVEHGGTIELVDSQLGGAAFSCTLPVAGPIVSLKEHLDAL